MDIVNRLCCLFITIVLLFITCGCSQNGKNDGVSLAEAYENAAQKLIDKGDYDTAIQALQEGIDVTNDEGLVELLENIETKQKESNKTAENEPEQTVEKEFVLTAVDGDPPGVTLDSLTVKKLDDDKYEFNLNFYYDYNPHSELSISLEYPQQSNGWYKPIASNVSEGIHSIPFTLNEKEIEELNPITFNFSYYYNKSNANSSGYTRYSVFVDLKNDSVESENNSSFKDTQ